MSIRFADLQDLPALIEGASRMHALTRFRSQPFDAQRVAESFAALIRHGPGGRYAFFIAEGGNRDASRIVGALIGVMEQQIFSPAHTASVMHIDVLPEARMGGHGLRLLKAFEQWARNRGAIELCFGINSETDTDKLGAFARRMGYRSVGENFVKANA
jgi:GNAT superfamily N-acetyltransferase